MTLSDSNLRLHTHIWRQDRLKCLKTTESVLVQIECVTVLWVSCVFKAGMWAALNDWRECWHVAAMRQVQEAQEKQHGFAGSQESSGQGRCLDRVKRFQLDLQTHDSRHELMRAGRQDRCVCVFTPDPLQIYSLVEGGSVLLWYEGESDWQHTGENPADVPRTTTRAIKWGFNEAVCWLRDRAGAAGRAEEENKHRKYSLRLSSEETLAATIQMQNGNMKVKQLLAARAWFIRVF